jgi:hypothetical protein
MNDMQPHTERDRAPPGGATRNVSRAAAQPFHVRPHTFPAEGRASAHNNRVPPAMFHPPKCVRPHTSLRAVAQVPDGVAALKSCQLKGLRERRGRA